MTERRMFEFQNIKKQSLNYGDEGASCCQLFCCWFIGGLWTLSLIVFMQVITTCWYYSMSNSDQVWDQKSFKCCSKDGSRCNAKLQDKSQVIAFAISLSFLALFTLITLCICCCSLCCKKK